MSYKLSPTIATTSGRYFNFLTPTQESIHITDIAKGLSNTCRFGGQCDKFYSVAEHCVIMSTICDPNLAFVSLMHDAAEAYTGDIPKPLKNLLPDFSAIEDRVESIVAEKYSLPKELPKEVKILDTRMLATEQVQVMGNIDDWGSTRGLTLVDVTIKFWTPKEAYKRFLDRFEALNNGKSK